MNIKRNRKVSDLHEIPDTNVLDLRSVSRPAVPVEGGRDRALQHFWTERPKTAAPKSRPAKAIGAPRRQRSDRSVETFRMRLRAAFGRFEFGSFPVVAAGLLIFIGLLAGVGSMYGLQKRVIGIARSGVDSLKVAGAQAAASDLTAASASFNQAAGFFSDAEAEFSKLNPTLVSLLEYVPIAGSKISSAKHLVAAAQAAAQAGAESTALAEPLIESGQGFAGPAGLVKRLEEDQLTVASVLGHLNTALDHVGQVNASTLPDNYASYVTALQSALPSLRESLFSVDDAIQILSDLLGTDEPREHLFVFQNSNELRPTGGFIGSFALIRMDRGEFHILDAPDKGSLDIDSYLPETVTPPLPLQVITPSWYFRDANWYPDWPTSAFQLSRFYEQARGFAPRGVIGVTNNFLERMLEVTGPVELTEYGVTVDAANVTATAQDQVERKYDLRTNDPKRFVADLIPVIATKLSSLDLGAYPRFLAAVAESVNTGDLQLWSSDQALQSILVELNWAGKLPAVNGDTLQLVDTNVGGGKTDGVIHEQIAQTMTVQPDGSSIVRVDVTRQHNGTLGDSFTGSRNRTYHRLYVPLGSRFLAAEGFDQMAPTSFRNLPDGSVSDSILRTIEGRVVVDEASGTRINDEFGRTVFGNWTELDPGQTKTFSLTYSVPTKFEDGLSRYDLRIGRQPGVRNRTYQLNVITPDGIRTEWVSDSTAEISSRGFSVARPLDRPFGLSFVLRTK